MNNDLRDMLQRCTRDRPGYRSIKVRAPATAEQVRAAMEGFVDEPPKHLLDLYTFSDGLEFGAFRIVPLCETYWYTPKLFVVHIWDNGDTDCVRMKDGAGGEVEFVGHDPPWQFQVASTMQAWIERLWIEYSTFGDIDDPLAAAVSSTSRVYRPPEHIIEQWRHI